MAGHKGRQPDVPGGREFVHQVKLTAVQERRLRELAAPLGVTPVRYMVEAALARGGDSPAARRALRAEFLRAQRQLSGVARNVNQMAAKSNSEGRLVEHADAIVDTVYGAIEELRDAVRGLQ